MTMWSVAVAEDGLFANMMCYSTLGWTEWAEQIKNVGSQSRRSNLPIAQRGIFPLRPAPETELSVVALLPLVWS